MVCEEESQGAEGFVNFLDNIFDAIFVKIAKNSQKHSNFHRNNTRFPSFNSWTRKSTIIFWLQLQKIYENENEIPFTNVYQCVKSRQELRSTGNIPHNLNKPQLRLAFSPKNTKTTSKVEILPPNPISFSN